MADELLDGLSVETRAASYGPILNDGTGAWRVMLNQTGPAINGFCASVAPSRISGLAVRTGEIAALYVKPECWRTGIGTALLTRALDDFRHDGLEAVDLWVLTENWPTVAFYEAHGFRMEPGSNGLDVHLGRSVTRMTLSLAG